MSPSQNELGDMLRYMRPAGSAAEKAFKSKFLTPLGVQWDSFGNGILHISGSPIIWSSHTDTVHREGGRQDVTMKQANRGAPLVARSNGSCLGADCTTGVFIMMNMIRAKVPGLYLFHAAEERGCQGSKFLAAHHEKTLSTYKAAIAFDRKGYTDVIEYQSSSRCCSKEFAASLAKALDRNYSAQSGVYTDTAEYVDFIGECTNISVGYFSQHTSSESQDVDFALWLADRMCKIDLSGLVYSRKAGEYESEYSHYGYGRYSSHHDYEDWGYSYRRAAPKTVYDLVDRYPLAISKLLLIQEWDFDTLNEYCTKSTAANTVYPNFSKRKALR